MVIIGYKQCGGKEKKTKKTGEEDEENDKIRLKKSSFMFAAQVLSLILLGNSTIYKDIHIHYLDILERNGILRNILTSHCCQLTPNCAMQCPSVKYNNCKQYLYL